ncbi:doubled CXXCH domain-containing protein [Malonomonas rubra DSM 5091]|uniref:Doubled CXXCH domain-containing protein n=1 Tax=Malonomonas rubra DSM 5091 TaxID=1122189 RepID=A0A1M6BYE8_MALRU|nr:cytochrome c3 family protein [Malonomonas rubra]SHI53802.1 doubled CXXCH domain-containing protein [Malonomonas rubra DSM 5091]
MSACAVADLEMQLSKKSGLHFFVVVLFVLSFGSEISAASRCVGCHEDIVAGSRQRDVVHRPVVKDGCEKCHLVNAKIETPEKKSPLVEKKKKKQKINWFWKSPGRMQEHWFRMSSEELNGNLFLNASDGRRRSSLLEVATPVLSKLPQKDPEQKPPKQMNIRVSGVRRSISTTVTLQWETDEYTDAEIRYGVGSLDSVEVVRQLATHHSSNLLGLSSGKTYRYQIISRDLFDNETASPVMTFSTDKSFWDTSVVRSGYSASSTDINLDWTLFRLAEDFLFVIKADRPVSVSLGRQGKVSDKTQATRKVNVGGGFSHPILKSAFETNITVCRTCHYDVQEEYSHPIKVRARSGMVIPAEYKLLPDGTMSCMTCHVPHASDNEYRLRKSKRSDLCRGCHTNY